MFVMGAGLYITAEYGNIMMFINKSLQKIFKVYSGIKSCFIKDS